MSPPNIDGEGDPAPLLGHERQFIADATHARLANHLAERFEEFRYRPPQSEVMSWQNSLGAMAQVLMLGDLRDQGVREGST